MIDIQCPGCTRKWGLPDSLGGAEWKCPICRMAIELPAVREKSASGKKAIKPAEVGVADRAPAAPALPAIDREHGPSAPPVPRQAGPGFELIEKPPASAKSHAKKSKHGHRHERPPVPTADQAIDLPSHNQIRKQLG